MSQLRAAAPAAAVAAVCAGVCMMLSGCSGGSIGPTANGTPAAGSSAASSSGSSGSSSGSSSSSSSSAPAAVSTAGLTGDFCADFQSMGQRLDKLPEPKNDGNLANEEATARTDIAAVEGTFNGLATEAPPNVAAAIHSITSLYQTELGNLNSFSSLSQLKSTEKDLTTNSSYTTAIGTLISYTVTKCK
jgi:hypothetical protein